MVDKLLNFYNQLTLFDPSNPIIVKYTKSDNVLSYYQLNKVVMSTSIKYMYLPKNGFKYGILTQDGYLNLMNSLKKLLAILGMSRDEIMPSIGELKIDFYQVMGSYTKYPRKLITLNLVNIKSRFITNIIMNRYSVETKTLLKLFKESDKKINKIINEQN